MISSVKIINSFFYSESYMFYCSSILKTVKLYKSNKFIIKFRKFNLKLLPSTLLIYKTLKKTCIIKYINKLTYLHNNYYNYLPLFLKLFKYNYIKFKSLFNKNIYNIFLLNRIILLYKSSSKGFKKVLKTVGLAIGFQFI